MIAKYEVSCHQRRSGGPPYEQTLVAGQSPYLRFRRFRADEDRLVDQGRVIDVWDHGGGHVLQSLQPVKRGVRLYGDEPDVGAHLPEEAPGSHERPARTDAGHEVRDCTLGLPPDLGPRGAVMGVGIGAMSVLIGIPIALRSGLRHLPRATDSSVTSLQRVGFNDLRPAEGEQTKTLR